MGDRCFVKNIAHITVTFPQHHNHPLNVSIRKNFEIPPILMHLHNKIKHSTFFLFLKRFLPKETFYLRYNPPSCFTRTDKAKIPAPFSNPTIVIEGILESTMVKYIFTSTEVANSHDVSHHLFCPHLFLMRKRLHL